MRNNLIFLNQILNCIELDNLGLCLVVMRSIRAMVLVEMRIEEMKREKVIRCERSIVPS
jgi:hypothetical protein